MDLSVCLKSAGLSEETVHSVRAVPTRPHSVVQTSRYKCCCSNAIVHILLFYADNTIQTSQGNDRM